MRPVAIVASLATQLLHWLDYTGPQGMENVQSIKPLQVSSQDLNGEKKVCNEKVDPEISQNQGPTESFFLTVAQKSTGLNRISTGPDIVQLKCIA